MGSPIVNLVVFAALVGVSAALWWPGVGVVPRTRRRREGAERVMLEDALKHIYHGELHAQTASIASLAGTLEVSQGKVLEVIERMQHAGLVALTDGRLILTEAGNSYALEVIRAHRLWERYLADETGVEPTRWHALAERREHVLTPDDVDELALKLGNPRFDPHGDPIPTRDGSVPDEAVTALSELRAGERAYVVHVEDEPDVVFAQLVALGVYLGMPLRVTEKNDERIVVEADGRSLVLAPIVAANVSIQRLAGRGEAEAAAEEGARDSLSNLAAGEVGEVVRISPACRGLERRRLMDLGVVPGTRIAFDRPGLTGGLSAYVVRGTVIALREEQTELIAIRRVSPDRDEGRREEVSR